MKGPLVRVNLENEGNGTCFSIFQIEEVAWEQKAWTKICSLDVPTCSWSLQELVAVYSSPATFQIFC